MPLPRLLPADDPATLAEAVTVLGRGGLVAVPTETVYGLAADATNGLAVARIYEAKGRPRFNPLICHVCDTAMARRYGCFDADADRLAAAFWPGPLTLITPLAPGAGPPVSSLVTAGLDSIGLRLPATDITRRIVAELGRPLAAPSANQSGRVSPTTAEAVVEELGDAVDLVLDAGPCPVGLESTIVACLDGAPRLLRPGGVPAEQIEAILGCALMRGSGDGDTPRAPGMLASHYAPNARLRLDATDVYPGEALLAFGPDLPKGAGAAVKMLNLSKRGDLTEAAANLFSHLRALDRSGARTIAVMPVPGHGLGEAIRDRLARAAAPRAG